MEHGLLLGVVLVEVEAAGGLAGTQVVGQLLQPSGLDNLITASYDLLGLISFLTDGKKECRAWTIRKGTKAPQAAGKIHSDFERGFIRASVIAYSDLEAHDFDYAAVKAKGLQRTEGKEYVVKDGDVIEFLFNV